MYVAKLGVVDALCGTTLKIQTLDKRTLAIPVVECVDANSQKIVGGEGMPRADGSGRGDLIIIFEIVMPNKLTPAQKSLVRAGFFTRVSSRPRSSTRRASPSSTPPTTARRVGQSALPDRTC